jgi:hypothetical protein
MATLTPSVRYYKVGVSKVKWATTVVTYTAPTRTEITAATELSGEIAEVNGFSVVSESIDTPDLANRFVSKVPGRITAEDSSISFYASSTGLTPASSIMPRDTTGFLLVMPAGDVATTGRMSVWPVTVGAVSEPWDLDSAAKVDISYTPSRVPAENIVIPA